MTAGPGRLFDVPYPRRAAGTLGAPGVVSHKKQFLPAALEVQGKVVRALSLHG